EIDEESDTDDIKADKDEDFKVELEIPWKVDDDGTTYDFIILVEGEDENNNDFEIRLEYVLEIEKEKDDVRIMEARLKSPIVSCNRRTELDLEILNLGKNDQDEVRITVTNLDLGLDFEEIDIELDEGVDDSEYTESIRIDAADVEPGDYIIEIDVYYDETKRPEQDYSETVILTVEKCAVSKPPVDIPDEDEEDDRVDIIIEPPKDDDTTIPGTQFPVIAQVEEGGFMGSIGYIALLGVAAIVLIGLIVLIVVLLTKKK
ncbi:MAG: hypothetical protein KAQ85_09470, partial [Thermodesulfovibrionia bacterium]|nr:hypothetical protein [Thermodesulfovibrionia bacterium]